MLPRLPLFGERVFLHVCVCHFYQPDKNLWHKLPDFFRHAAVCTSARADYFVRLDERFAPLRAIVKTFVWIIRGTPLMLQIIIIFYGPGLLWDGDLLPRLTAVCVAFVINYACYFSEIYRGGIQSIPRGQYEAGQVLGMTKSQIFFKVTLLQVIKRVIPPMGNEFMTLIKDTALANVIATKEIIMMSKEYATKGLIWPLFFHCPVLPCCSAAF